MIINSSEVPQADRLSSILQVVVNIKNGATTDNDIQSGVEGINTDRQGRYYRLVTELLGFVVNNNNHAVLTPLGEKIAENPQLNNPYLIDAILGLKIFQIIIPFVELSGRVTREAIISYLQTLEIPLAQATLDRRVSSLLSWLKDLKIIDYNSSEKVYQIESMISPITGNYESSINYPILPKSAALKEYKEIEARVFKAAEMIPYYKDQAKLERSSNAHSELVNLVSKRIKDVGGVPKSNILIDLATTIQEDYLFEMKSVNTENLKSQIRKGVSQLYEYKYLQNLPEANLVLVLEKPLTSDTTWMLDYLESDRSINVIWDGDGNLYGSEQTKAKLPFLGLI